MALLLFVLSVDTSVATPQSGAREYIVPAARARDFYHSWEKTAKFWTPSATDIERMRPKLAVFLKSQKDPNWPQPKPLPELSRFGRQYVGVIIGGRKQIWVNASWATELHLSHIDQPFRGDDRGCSAWWIYYDLTGGKFSGFDCDGVL